MRAETLGAADSVDAVKSGHSSATVRATAAAIVVSVSTTTTERTDRDRASPEMRLTVTSTANPHQHTSARLGDVGKPITPYRFHSSCPTSQQPAAAAHSVWGRR